MSKSGSATVRDTLQLTSAQEQTLYSDISKLKTAGEAAPSGFDARIGAVVPNLLRLPTVPASVSHDVPAAKALTTRRLISTC
jgi:hypothetical protein